MRTVLKVRPKVVKYYGYHEQRTSTGVWGSATVGGSVAFFSVLTQITVAAGSTWTKTESTALLWCSKSLMISPQLLMCLPRALASLPASTVFMQFIFQVKALDKSATRNEWPTHGQRVTRSDLRPVSSVSLANCQK